MSTTQFRLLGGIAALAALVVVSAPTPAGALVICKSRKGTLTARDTCKKKELQLDATSIGAKGDPGAAGAPGAPGPGFVVLDANGNEVGTLLTSSTNSTNVLREIDGAFYVLQVTADGFFRQDDADRFIGYTSSTCTGARYMSALPPFAPAGSIAPTLMASADGQTGFYVRNAEAAQVAVVTYIVATEAGADDVSARQACNARPGTVVKDAHDCPFPLAIGYPRCVWCCEAGNIGGIIAPAHPVDLGSLGLTPPFTLHHQ